MKINVKVDSNYKVEDIERNKTIPDWVETYQNQEQKLPPLPDFLIPLVNNYTKEQPITKDIVVIPISGQQWQGLTSEERNRLLELVEFTGKDIDEYVRHFEGMYPRNPDFHKRIR